MLHRKQSRYIAVLLLLLTISLFFTSCDYTKKVIGTWDSEDTLSVQGIEVNRLVFAEDGSGYASGSGGTVIYTFVLTDDTMTFRFPDIGVGMQYTVRGDTLTVHDCTFTRTGPASGLQ